MAKKDERFAKQTASGAKGGEQNRKKGRQRPAGERGDGYDDPNISQTQRDNPFPHIQE